MCCSKKLGIQSPTRLPLSKAHLHWFWFYTCTARRDFAVGDFSSTSWGKTTASRRAMHYKHAGLPQQDNAECPVTHTPVILGHVLRRVPEDVADDAHGWRGWVDEGVAHHKLLQDVVLDCTLEKVLCCPLLLGRCYVPEASKPSRRPRAASSNARSTMTGGLSSYKHAVGCSTTPGSYCIAHCTYTSYLPACCY